LGLTQQSENIDADGVKGSRIALKFPHTNLALSFGEKLTVAATSSFE
jgi:hypothetical protein